MKKRKLNKVLAVMLVVSMVMAAAGCGSRSGAESTEVKSEDSSGENVNETVAAEVNIDEDTVQYGGTLTAVDALASRNEPSWDVVESSSVSAQWYLSPVEESLMEGDVINKGPRGTNENAYNTFQAEISDNLLIGALIESWDYTQEPLGVTFKVRPGVYWQANENIGMESREVTAEDIAYHINRYRSSSKASKMEGWTDENPAQVIDENTVFLSFTKPFASWAFVVGYALYNNVYPEEMVDANPNQWTSVAGTGPFAISSYTEASNVTYIKNENWRLSEQNINGEVCQAPFVDQLVLPIMPDESVQISALRAGQIDIMTGVNIMYKETLQSTCPELNLVESPSGSAYNLRFNSTNGPCADMDFRRALLIGTDNETLTATFDGAVMGGYPYSYSLGESIYTPIEDLPDDVKILYGYDPDLALSMLEEGGYAGETMTLNYISTDTTAATIAELLADQWSKLGLNVQLNVVDAAVYASYDTGDGTGWSGALIKTGGNSKTSRGIENSRNFTYLNAYSDEKFNQMMDEMMAETDTEKREALIKEAAVYFMGTVDEFGLFETTSLNCWWPWVKNYYGESDAGCYNMAQMFGTAWIDQNLKKEMGY